jgi:hypothetical protein
VISTKKINHILLLFNFFYNFNFAARIFSSILCRFSITLCGFFSFSYFCCIYVIFLSTINLGLDFNYLYSLRYNLSSGSYLMNFWTLLDEYLMLSRLWAVLDLRICQLTTTDFSSSKGDGSYF